MHLLLNSYKGVIYPFDISLSQNTLDIYAGNTYQLTAKINPANTKFKNIIRSSTDDTIVKVDSNGLVTGVGDGVTTIKATGYGVEAICTCTSTIAHPTSVSLNKSSISFSKTGSTTQLTATVTPTYALNKDVTWSTSNSAVATVSTSGLVTAKGEGNCTITCTTVDGSKTATCSVSCSFAWTGTCTYTYTGAAQTFTAPCTQKYRIEVWGAQGGCNGGYGGYSCGEICIASGKVLCIYVGGCGGTCSSMSSSTAYIAPGGWNGGGCSANTCYSGTSTYVGGGGGATDVRYNGSTLCNRFIVAGGGGGNTSNSMCAGTYRAGGGECGCGGCRGCQTGSLGGSFGVGQNGCLGTNYKYHAGGGGGGWYGGGTSTCHSDSTNCGACASGGSGFVYTSTYCANHPNKACLGDLPLMTSGITKTCDKTGCGCAKITGLAS